jgi:hypothetical protein
MVLKATPPQLEVILVFIGVTIFRKHTSLHGNFAIAFAGKFQNFRCAANKMLSI